MITHHTVAVDITVTVQTSLATLLEQLDSIKVEDGDHLCAFKADYDIDTTTFNRIELKSPEKEVRFDEIRILVCNQLSTTMYTRFDPIVQNPVLSAARVFDHVGTATQRRLKNLFPELWTVISWRNRRRFD